MDLLHNQNSFNIVGIASKNRTDTWNIIVRINNGTENVMVSIGMSKLQRAKLNLAHKQGFFYKLISVFFFTQKFSTKHP